MAHAVIGNFGLGVAMAATQIAGTALIQLIAPGRFRGRVMSVLNLQSPGAAPGGTACGPAARAPADDQRRIYSLRVSARDRGESS